MLFRRPLAKSATKKSRRNRQRVLALGLESLEDRRLLAVIVTSTLDTIDPLDGVTTLREAITHANDNPGVDTIRFAIPGTGPHTIKPASTLPTITDPVIIDGYTQPGATENTNATTSGSNANLQIVLDGSLVGNNGLSVSAGGSTIRGLVVNQFANGIVVHTAGGNTIEGNFIGTDVTGMIAQGNTFDGVNVVAGSDGNWIGGISPAQRNVISGNGHSGVILDGSSNVIQGNIIGLDATGQVDIGNIQTGVLIRGGHDNLIGGTLADARNIISGNGRGIEVKSIGVDQPIDNDVRGNYIGTDVTGSLDVGNSLWGVFLNNTGPGNTIAANLISGNDRDGVYVLLGSGSTITSNSIHSNSLLGINLGEGSVTPNDLGDGDTGANGLQNFPVLSLAASAGGNSAVLGTLNSTANTTFTVELFANTTADPSGYGEGEIYLGSTNVTTDTNGDASFVVNLAVSVTVGHILTATATDPAGNTSEFSQGVAVAACSLTVFSTSDSGLGSLRDAIECANATPGLDTIDFQIPGAGVHTIQPLSALPTISDPVVIDGYTHPGTSPNTLAIGNNSQYRVEISGLHADSSANGFLIETDGGGSTIRGLVIHDFQQSAIRVEDSSGNVIEGNFLGIDVTGTVSRANQTGVLLSESGNNRIGSNLDGTDDAGERNVISGNASYGIYTFGASSDDNIFAGNYVGTNADGTAALANAQRGIVIGGGRNATIRDNTVSGNGLDGILLNNSQSTGVVIQGNKIGADASGMNPLGNQFRGIFSVGPNDVTIGGTGPGEANTIAFNADAGVLISGNRLQNRVSGNSIHSNGGLGIDLGGDGVTANDSGDGDSGANGLQNFPVLSAAFRINGSTIISGTLESQSNTSFTIEFFSNTSLDPSGFGEGRIFIGSASVDTDGSGIAGFSASFPVEIPFGDQVTATATDPAGNTSELSLGSPVLAANSQPTIGVVDVVGAVTEDDSTPNLSDTGSVTFSDEDETNVLTSSVAKTSEVTSSTVAIPATLSAALDGAVTLVQTGSNDGTIDWTFTLDNSLVQYLALGETVTATYTITVNDNSGTTNATATQDVTVTIHGVNDQPTITELYSSNESVENKAKVNVPVFIDGGFLDVDISDGHLVTVDWGVVPGNSDSETFNPTEVEPSTTGTFAKSHTYAEGGIYTVTVTVDDLHGGVVSQTTTIVIAGVGVVDGTLYVIGTDGKDKVDIKLKGSDGGADQKINVKGEFDTKGDKQKFDIDYPAGSVTDIVIILCGDDHDAHVHNSVSVDAFIDGGDGDDKLKGGSGNDTILGGAGEDDIKGYDGNDLLDGGDDDDKLQGGKGSDILLGGAGDDDLKAGSDGGSDGASDGVGDILSGGDGDDRLTGSNGMDILIGGLGADDIQGGGSDGGGDLFVGGKTDHDDDPNALLQIQAIWTSTDTLAQKTNALTAGGGLLATVSGDGKKDKLEGHKKSIDLFFAELGVDSLKGDKDDDGFVWL